MQQYLHENGYDSLYMEIQMVLFFKQKVWLAAVMVTVKESKYTTQTRTRTHN